MVFGLRSAVEAESLYAARQILASRGPLQSPPGRSNLGRPFGCGAGSATGWRFNTGHLRKGGSDAGSCSLVHRSPAPGRRCVGRGRGRDHGRLARGRAELRHGLRPARNAVAAARSICSRASSRRRAAMPTRSSSTLRSGTVDSPAVRSAMTQLLSRVAALPHVAGVVSPYAPDGSRAGLAEPDDRVRDRQLRQARERAPERHRQAAARRRLRRPRARPCRSPPAARWSRTRRGSASARPPRSGWSRR